MGTHWRRIEDAFGTLLGQIGDTLRTRIGDTLRTLIGDALGAHWGRIRDTLGRIGDALGTHCGRISVQYLSSAGLVDWIFNLVLCLSGISGFKRTSFATKIGQQNSYFCRQRVKKAQELATDSMHSGMLMEMQQKCKLNIIKNETFCIAFLGYRKLCQNMLISTAFCTRKLKILAKTSLMMFFIEVQN